MSLVPKKTEAAKKQYPPFEELTKIIYAEPKVGKTTFMSQDPCAVFCATEPGQHFVNAPKQEIYFWGVLDGFPDSSVNFQDFVRELWALKQKGELEYKTCVIDIVDNLWSMCLDYKCAMKGIDYPPENDYGKTWKEVRTEWETWMRRLMQIMNVTFITHCANDKKELEIKPGVKKEVTRFIPTFKGNKAAQYLDGVVNCMGYAFIDGGGNRKITFRGDPSLGTGDRTNILEQLGELDLNFKVVSDAYAAKAKELGIEIVSKWQAPQQPKGESK